MAFPKWHLFVLLKLYINGLTLLLSQHKLSSPMENGSFSKLKTREGKYKMLIYQEAFMQRNFYIM